MYLLNPPIWYLKSTINNLKILHQATRMRDQLKIRSESSTTTDEGDLYSFWIDFFSDAINSNSASTEERELPAQVPVSLKQTNQTRICSSIFRFLFVIIMKNMMEQQ
jgi:hypothetical protein